MRLAFSMLACIACGARSELGELPQEETPPPRPPSRPEVPAYCLASSLRTQAPASAVRATCDAVSGTDLGVVIMAKDEVVGVSAEGPRSLARLDPTVDARSIVDVFLVTSGDYVAVSSTSISTEVKDPRPSIAQTLLFRRDGTLLHRYTFPGTHDGSGRPLGFFVSDRGVIVQAQMEGRESTTLVLHSGEVLSGTPGVEPVGTPAPDGSFLVREYDSHSPENRLLWVDPCTGATQVTRYSQQTTRSTYRIWEHRLVYPSRLDPSELLIEEPSAITSIDLGQEADLLEIHPAGFALLATATPGRVVVADLHKQSARTVVLDLPGEPMGIGFSDQRALGARITSDGRLYVTARDGALGALYVSEDGSSWRAVGLPIGEVYAAAAREAQGAFYLYGDTNAINIPAWPPPPPGVERLDRNSIQVARESGASVVVYQSQGGRASLDYAWTLSSDGECVSRYGDPLFLKATRSGTESEIIAERPGYRIDSLFLSGQNVRPSFD